jgi:hypothetical protein
MASKSPFKVIGSLVSNAETYFNYVRRRLEEMLSKTGVNYIFPWLKENFLGLKDLIELLEER